MYFDSQMTFEDIETAMDNGIDDLCYGLINAIHTVPDTGIAKNFNIAISNAYKDSCDAVKKITFTRDMIAKCMDSRVFDSTVLIPAGADANSAFISSLEKSIKEAAAELDAARSALEVKVTTTATFITTLQAAIREVRAFNDASRVAAVAEATE